MLKKLLEKRAKCIADARAVIDKAESEKRDSSPEEIQQFDKLMKEAADIKAQVAELEQGQKRIDSLKEAEGEMQASQGRQTNMQLASQSGSQPVQAKVFKLANGTEIKLDSGRDTPDYLDKFDQFMRGNKVMASLSQGTDADGGYLTPEAYVARLIQAIDDLVFIRKKATILTVKNAESLGVPTLVADPSDAEWTTELQTGNEDSTMEFGKRTLTPSPTAKRIKLSKTLMRNSAIAVEALVRQRLAYKFGITQEKAFLTGSGTGQPLGVFTASANGISTGRDISTGNTATAITFDGLKSAKFALKAPYRAKADWMFHRDALLAVSKLKDGDGQYLWRVSNEVGEPDRLLGVPVNESEYVPNTFTTGLYVGMIGDFSNYWIADALTMTIQVLTELYAETNQNGYIGRLECDGMPVLEEAFARVTLG